MNSVGGVVNPVSPQGSVITNAIFDRHFYSYRANGNAKRQALMDEIHEGTADPAVFSMMPRELSFRLSDAMSRPLNRPACGGVNDLPLKIFTSFNCFPVTKNMAHIDTVCGTMHDVASMLKQVILSERARFVGVPLIPIKAAVDHQKDTVSVCCGGSTTIVNTGPQSIQTGDTVVVVIPTTQAERAHQQMFAQQNGEPARKVLAMTLPFRPAEVLHTANTFVNAMKDSAFRHGMKPIVDDLRNTAPGFAALIDSGDEVTAEQTMYIIKSVTNVVGVALTSARKGAQFDILIRGGL